MAALSLYYAAQSINQLSQSQAVKRYGKSLCIEQMFDDNNNYLELTLGMLGLLVTFFVYYFIYEIAKMRFSLRMYFSRFGNYLTMLHLFLVGLAICFILFRWQS